MIMADNATTFILETFPEVIVDNSTSWNNTNSTAQNLQISTGKSKLEIFVYSFNFIQASMYLVCFLANLLTIIAVVKFEKLHKRSTNILILSLSVADGLLGKNIYLTKFRMKPTI